MIILVVDKNKTKYSEKYKIFLDPQKAIDYSEEIGWSKNSWFGKIKLEDLKSGVCNMIDSGDISIEVIALEVN